MMKTLQFVLIVAVINGVFVGEIAGIEEAYQIKAKDLHNHYRVKHGSPPLEINEDLNHRAMQCAQYYLGKGVFDMTCPFKLSNGENLYAMGGGKGTLESVTQRAVDNWYSKGAHYDYSKNEFQGKCGQFTQLVWKGSAELGFGIAIGNGMAVAVALYSPAGNVLGRFKTNVLDIQ